MLQAIILRAWPSRNWTFGRTNTQVSCSFLKGCFLSKTSLSDKTDVTQSIFQYSDVPKSSVPRLSCRSTVSCWQIRWRHVVEGSVNFPLAVKLHEDYRNSVWGHVSNELFSLSRPSVHLYGEIRFVQHFEHTRCELRIRHVAYYSNYW